MFSFRYDFVCIYNKMKIIATQHLLSAYNLPGIVFSDLLFQKRNQYSRYRHDPHLTDEETEAEDSYLLCQAWLHS